MATASMHDPRYKATRTNARSIEESESLVSGAMNARDDREDVWRALHNVHLARLQLELCSLEDVDEPLAHALLQPAVVDGHERHASSQLASVLLEQNALERQ